MDKIESVFLSDDQQFSLIQKVPDESLDGPGAAATYLLNEDGVVSQIDLPYDEDDDPFKEKPVEPPVEREPIPITLYQEKKHVGEMTEA